MTLAVNFGKWGGVYWHRQWTTRLCLGWVAFTYYPADLITRARRIIDELKHWREGCLTEHASRRAWPTSREFSLALIKSGLNGDGDWVMVQNSFWKKLRQWAYSGPAKPNAKKEYVPHLVDARAALRALYIAVDKDVADEVWKKTEAAFTHLIAERTASRYDAAQFLSDRKRLQKVLTSLLPYAKDEKNHTCWPEDNCQRCARVAEAETFLGKLNLATADLPPESPKKEPAEAL